MPRLAQRLVQKQILAPQQILQASLLQLPMANLEQKILEELESNPVLEAVESLPETEAPAAEITEEEPVDWDALLNDPEGYVPPGGYRGGDEEAERPIPDQQSFVEGLIRQLDFYDLQDWERQMAEEILWNLDERGYLATGTDLIADRFERSEVEVEAMLKLVQHLDPVGIGARDLRECILVQLDHAPGSLSYRIVETHFDDFANRRYGPIQSALKCSSEELAAAVQEIARLNPYPGEGRLSLVNLVVVPDLTVREQDGAWVIVNNDTWLPELRINSSYRMMLNEKHGPEVHQYVKQKLDSAHWFIQAVRQRRQTMLRVMRAIIEHQPEFFAGEIHNLRPLKLQDIADRLELDISTISRATRGKYVDTPYGVFELKAFFSEGIALQTGVEVSTRLIKETLRELIDGEDKHHPYNDERLVGLLRRRGYPVARRTVAKYREHMKIPVARLRREI